eukprot:Skav214049  [mRNA]  locus=scaffold2017:365264:365892:- [translate_table: standard]
MTIACASIRGFYALKEELEKLPKDSAESSSLQKQKDAALKDGLWGRTPWCGRHLSAGSFTRLGKAPDDMQIKD